MHIPEVEVTLCRYDGIDEDGDHWIEDLELVYSERYLCVGREWKEGQP